MRPLFYFASELVESVKLKVPKEANLSFNKSIISLEKMIVNFSSSKYQIEISLSVHHLDIPWYIKIEIKDSAGALVPYENLKLEKEPNGSSLIVTPLIIREEAKLKSLARDVANHITYCLDNCN